MPFGSPLSSQLWAFVAPAKYRVSRLEVPGLLKHAFPSCKMYTRDETGRICCPRFLNARAYDNFRVDVYPYGKDWCMGRLCAEMLGPLAWDASPLAYNHDDDDDDDGGSAHLFTWDYTCGNALFTFSADRITFMRRYLPVFRRQIIAELSHTPLPVNG